MQNPQSFLVCAGVQDVLNMPFKTDYRGTLYIYSSGRFAYKGMPDFSGLPVPVIHEFNRNMSEIEEIARGSKYIDIPEQGVRITLKNEEKQDPRTKREYDFLARVYRFYRQHPDEPFFITDALVGRVDLVGITHHADSPWAKSEHFHWVLQNPRLFRTPISGVRDQGMRSIWSADIAENQPEL